MRDRDVERRRWRMPLSRAVGWGAGLGGVGLGAALVAVVWQSPARGQTLIEILKVFVSWPFVVLILGLSFGWAFQDELRRFLSEVRRLGYGGATLEREQARVSKQVEEEDEPDAPATPPTEVTSEVEIQTQLQQMYQQAMFWWLRFLDLYLVPNSKDALRWLRNVPATREWFHRIWAPRIPSQRERDAILEALLSHQLVYPDRTSGQYRVTSAGQVFLESQVHGLGGQPPEH